MRITALALALALIASEANAVSWLRDGEGGPISELRPPGTARALPTSNTDDVEVLDVIECENIDFGLSGDLNGDGTTASLFTATLQWCPINRSDASVNTNAKRDAACVDYSNGTLTGDGTLQGAGVPSGQIRVNVGGTFAADPVLWIHCNGPK